MQTLDLGQARALVRKEFRQRRSALFADKAGAVFRLVLLLGLCLAFTVFFAKFAAIYLKIGTGGERLYELMALSLFLLFLSLTAGGISSIARALSSGENGLYAAMPLGKGTLLAARLFLLYLGQFLFSLLAVLLFGGAVSRAFPVGAKFWGALLFSAFTLPLFSAALSAALALPWRIVTDFFKTRALHSLVAVTALLFLGLWGYARLLYAVKELLLGDDLKYFFSENLLEGIHKTAGRLFPANFYADMLGGGVKEGVAIALLSVLCLLFAFFVLKALFERASGAQRTLSPRHRRGKRAAKRHSAFYALFKKEFLEVLRTPSYAFSCFSVALALPLMVYACMEIGSSLVKRLVGIALDAELALLLLLLFGALTNMFCSTNISREGKLFLSSKGLPVGYGQIIGAKTLFCLSINALSQGAAALLLWLTGHLIWQESLLLFAVGSCFSLSQICFATRFDLTHARFSSWDEEARESGGTASACILVGLFLAFLGGGGAFLLRLLLALRFQKPARFLSFALAGGILSLAAVGSLIYLLYGLKRRYLAAGGDL